MSLKNISGRNALDLKVTLQKLIHHYEAWPEKHSDWTHFNYTAFTIAYGGLYAPTHGASPVLYKTLKK